MAEATAPGRGLVDISRQPWAEAESLQVQLVSPIHLTRAALTLACPTQGLHSPFTCHTQRSVC